MSVKKDPLMEIICIFLLSDLKCHSCLPDGPQHACARAPGQRGCIPSEMLGRSLRLHLTDFNGAGFNPIHLILRLHSCPLWDKSAVTFVNLCHVLRLHTETVSPTAGLACARTRNLYSSPSFSAAVKFNPITHHMTDFIFFFRFKWVFKGWIGRVPHKKNQRAEIIYKCQQQSIGLPKQPLILTGQPIILSL